MDYKRLGTADACAAVLGVAREHAAAARLARSLLDTIKNKAVSLLDLGECAKAVVLLWAMLAVWARTVEVGEIGTLTSENSLVSVLPRLVKIAEAEALARGAVGKMRRILCRDHIK